MFGRSFVNGALGYRRGGSQSTLWHDALQSRGDTRRSMRREHEFRRPARFNVCLSLHFDCISSPRLSNPPSGFPAPGFCSKSSLHSRKAGRTVRAVSPTAFR